MNLSTSFFSRKASHIAPRSFSGWAAVFLLLALSISGCNDYWWQRGQPPGVDVLLQRSAKNLKTAQDSFGNARADVSKSFEGISNGLDKFVALVRSNSSPDALQAEFDSLISSFMGLEDKLSLGSRPAYGELAGQLRSFGEDISGRKRLTFGTIGLFAARTKNFFASELSVPAPVS